MIEKICETCSASFEVKPYRANTARFCSGSCRAKWVTSLPHACGRGKPKPYMVGNKWRLGIRPTNPFELGHDPWNKNLRGIHLSPETEFAVGHKLNQRAAVGTESIRRTHDGNLRVFLKVEDPNVWMLRAKYVWEQANEPVTKGMVVHHDDGDTLNDAIANLRCVTVSEHAKIHSKELTRARWGS
jgi:hypothetical protein